MTPRSWIGVCAAACVFAGSAHGGSFDARKLIADGNALFESGKFNEAREVYASTPEPTEPELLADLLHNRAAAEFKLGNYAAARDIWVRASGMLDAAFEAKAGYNLGNCSYREALELLESSQAPTTPDPAAQPQPKSPPIEQIIGLLGKAIERYRDALRLDPTLTDARANMELADQLRKKIKEQASSQPQSQQSSQPQSQPGSQPSENQDGQGDQQSQSQPSSKPSSQKSQSQPSEGDQQQDNQEGQQDQQQPQSQPAQSQPSSQPQPQPQPESQPQSQPAEGQEDEQENKMSPGEFERLLQKVRDAERLRRQRMREAERSRQRPVDKDW